MSVVAKRVLVTGGAGFRVRICASAWLPKATTSRQPATPLADWLARAITYFNKLLSECGQSSAEEQSLVSRVRGRMGQ
jgi:hypothetical protein